MSDQPENDKGSSSQGRGSSGGDLAKSQGKDPGPTMRPSQAEGDRETVEQDISEKEAEGKL